MTQLGKALGILVRAEVDECLMHEDVSAFGAPSECHCLVARGEAARYRQARRHAEAVAQLPHRKLLQALTERQWQRAHNRIYGRLARERWG